MHLKRLELNGFKSFAHKSEFVFDVPIIAIVGPNGSGKSNVVEAIRFVLGEQSVKSMRGKTGSDLIFKGSKEVSAKSRAGVTITFDNRDRVFTLSQGGDQSTISVDFDEIVIGREVFADGTSVYTINGTEVRMKDIHELIASVNIGSSGHHIISQGEADRYLNANARDRRTLIEEALGLKMYQYRIKESERKLERAQDNLREAELMRRELAPHLKFLKRQVEKLEKAKEIRVELETSYREYFQKEDFLIEQIRLDLEQAGEQLESSLAEVQSWIDAHGALSTHVSSVQPQLEAFEQQLEDIRNQKQRAIREISKVEGMMSVLATPERKEPARSYSRDTVVSLVQNILTKLDTVAHDDTHAVSEFFTELRTNLSSFIHDESKARPEEVHQETLANLQVEKDRLEQDYESIELREREILNERDQAREQERLERIKKQESERSYYEHLAQLKELQTRKELLGDKRNSLARRIEDRDEEYQEARVLLGAVELVTQGQMIESFQGVTAESQNLVRREIERSKIRLEDIGGGSGVEIIQEYDETARRDEFLEKEINDVTTTITSLNQIITDLKSQLNVEFGTGIAKINTEFNRFFNLMFGGGHASLKEVTITRRKPKVSDESSEQLEIFEEDENLGYGIDIEVSLPRKKVTDLDMLSGGERSLTSIALLFALSQVNPPPFLVLDETDAALDEANSQKYGDMIEALSSYSQLILVTHNRETMSRAQTLFGVTLGRDDASTTLSLRLEDAEKYAK
jgi:chromosome segregation protein